MLQHVASQVDPIWGIISVILAGLAILAIVIQLFVVKRKVWDDHAKLAFSDEEIDINHTNE